MAAPVFFPVAAIFALDTPSILKSVTLPVKASYIPLNTTTRPCPPESTTPASFKTGSISGVFDKTSSACSIIFNSASSMSSVSSATSAAFCRACRLIRYTLCNGKNCSFLRLHNGLVCCFCCSLCCSCNVFYG